MKFFDFLKFFQLSRRCFPAASSAKNASQKRLARVGFYCADYRCAPSIAVSDNHWKDALGPYRAAVCLSGLRECLSCPDV
jgi:hypothetical protein